MGMELNNIRMIFDHILASSIGSCTFDETVCCGNAILFLNSSFTARQDYITHFEPSQSLGGTKTGDSLEKQPVHRQAELGLFQI